MTAPCTVTWPGINHPGGTPHSCIRRHLTTDAEPSTFHACVCGSDIHEVTTAEAVLLQPVTQRDADIILGRVFGSQLDALRESDRLALGNAVVLAALSPDDERLPA
jgi:hypothetical protein